MNNCGEQCRILFDTVNNKTYIEVKQNCHNCVHEEEDVCTDVDINGNCMKYMPRSDI